MTTRADTGSKARPRGEQPSSSGPGEVALGQQVPPKAIVWERTIAADHGRRDYWLRRVLLVLDMTALLLAAEIAFTVSNVRPQSDLLWMLPTLPAWALLFAIYGLYRRDVKRINQGALDDIPYLFHALVIGTLVLWVYFRFGPPEEPLVFMELFVFGLASGTLILMLRWAARRGATAALGAERVLIVGEAQVTAALVRKMNDHPEYALDPVGVMTDRSNGSSVSELPVLGQLTEPAVAAAIDRHRVERVIVAQDAVENELMLALLRTCGQAQVKLSVVPRSVEIMGPSVEVDDIEGVTVLGINPLVLPRTSRMMKRAMDLVGAAVGLLLLSPVMAVTAIAVKLDSPGPVLFRQSRIGKRGEVFWLPKFRTMVPDAEARREGLLSESSDEHWLKLESDPRITRVGRFLRHTSLDELPQLWTVFVGRMSLVGPRPLIAEEHERVLDWAQARLDLAPGITGLWQVLGRTNIPFEEMVKLDYVYVSNWSLWTDVKLLLRTFPAVVRRRGVN